MIFLLNNLHSNGCAVTGGPNTECQNYLNKLKREKYFRM